MFKFKTKLLLQGFLMAAIVLCSSSCKKDSKNSDSDFYVRIKNNGTAINYATVLGELGADLADASYTDLGVTASTADGKEIFDISIQVSGDNLSTGTYSSDDPNHLVIVSMVTNDGSTLHHFGNEEKDGMAPSKYTINITSITSEVIEGTFSGNYLYDSFGTDGSDVMLITEGEFRVKRLR
jgi:hypothetical protein